jgi:transposase InsO family protein
MTENGDPYENAVAERVNGILKMEYDLEKTFTDYYQAAEQVKSAVTLYNNSRPHKSCAMLTPAAAHKRTGELKKHWKDRNRTKSISQTGDPGISATGIKRE